MSDFTILGELHASADAVLCQGVRNRDHEKVLIKLLKSQHPSPRELEKLRYEYTLMRDLALPGVVSTHGLHKHEGMVALVMEDLETESLSNLLRAGRLSLERALKIASSLAETLEAIHQRRVIHKDINPRTIVLTAPGGQVKLIDFSVATRLSQENQQARSVDALEGTLAYMSPEQTGRMNRTLDRRTDLYSMGVTLYEMLTGRLPFPATDPMELVHSHIARKPLPPHELAPEVPRVVSDIVMKLLAKAAEDRYQSARGLKVDLDACLSSLAKTGAIAPFPLAQRDFTGELRVPQGLYGRAAETGALLSTFERVSQGKVELVLVKGLAGVGKSVLINEIHKPIAQRGGAFVYGKFDQLSQRVPYAAIAQALQELLRSLVTGSQEELGHLREQLLAALGLNAQLLIDLIPALGRILGPQPSVPDLGPSESQNRWNLAFQSIVPVFATAARPLVIFLDDLQWADPASLKLLQTLLTSEDSAYLLMIGAYRDNEVDAAHPLLLARSELAKAGASIGEITLRPLDALTVTQLCADTLQCDAERAAPLAELIFEKTQGNPFFINQLLGSLYRDGRITWSSTTDRWTWDIQGVREAGITDNVVTLMVTKLQRLAPATQHILELAACIGHKFDIRTLAIIHETYETQVARDLWEALREGLIMPLDSEYRFLLTEGDAGADVMPPSSSFQVSYKFAHDRVQQAAYSLIDEEHRQAVHLRIGRLLLASRDEAGRDDDLFTHVYHLNLGARLIVERSEQRSIAARNLAAGKRAKRATAYETAAQLFANGLALAGDLGWEDDYAVTFALSAERAECEYLIGHFEDAEALFDVIRRRARTTVERGQIENLRVILFGAVGKVAEAVALGRQALALFGIDLPEEVERQEAALNAAFAEVEKHQRGRRVADLIDAPRMTDPEKVVALSLLSNVFNSAYVVSPLLLVLTAVLQANLNLQYGHAEGSPFGYMVYGFVLATMGRYAEAHEFGRLALALNERGNGVLLTTRLNNVFGMTINYAQKPLRTSIPYYQRSIASGPTSGDLMFMCFSAVCLIDTRIGLGDELDGLLEEVERLRVLVERRKNPANTLLILVSRQLILSLMGKTRSLTSFDDDTFNEAELAATLEQPMLATARCWYHAAKLHLLLLADRNEEALAAAIEAERCAGAAAGYYFLVDLSFRACLAILRLPSASAEGEEREAREAMFTRHQRKIELLAEACPENFLQKHLLIAAEQARVQGDRYRAMELYDEAITAAQANEFPEDEALAGELAAKLYLSLGRERLGRAYLGEARGRYQSWGAVAKVRALDAKTSVRPPPLPAEDATGAARPLPIDTLTVIKASQALSGEIDLDKLLTQLMTLALENAGASRGALLRGQADELIVEAVATVDKGDVMVLRPAAARRAIALPSSILNYVQRTHESVILNDATVEARFESDAYILSERPKSVLCLPLLRQSALVGVLYLENNLTADAFTGERVALLSVLSSQAAISLENAHLYAELEQRVRDRTAQLSVANKELEAFSYSVSHDLRTPLRAIDGFSRMLIDDHGKGLPPDALDLLSRVRRASSRMSELIDDMLSLSQVTRAEMKRGPVDLGALGREIAADLERASSGRQITWIIADELRVNGDAKLLRIALENLLGNALKFTSKHPTARIELGATEPPDGKTAYFVRDDGAGFDMRYAGKLFGTFQRMHTGADFEGTGVGLSTVQRIIHRHGGRIWGEGAVEQGATFYFTL